MSRIAARFAALGRRKALVTFITAGDPAPGITVGLMHGLVKAGADIIELGVPFSDPMADGPVIQRASERALAHGVGLVEIFAMVQEFRRADADTPVVLMGYLNPMEAMGYEAFAAAAAAAGCDGVLTVDVPPEESAELVGALEAHGLDPIFLVAPTTSPRRMGAIAGQARGFVYYVSLKGVTGSAALDVDSVARKVAEIREHTTLPVGVGFGIRDARSAARVAEVADAVVVGSAIIGCLEANLGDSGRGVAEAEALVRSLREGMDAVATAVPG
ncbi:MAG: tryptophan synthase subunit alpha [Gammaproteobacteria bacterium]|nr:tryptophan synthase subunit alpha [Gammaproteobacteria bacterium]